VYVCELVHLKNQLYTYRAGYYPVSNKKCYSLGSPVARELNHKLATGVKGVKPPVTNLLPLAGLEPACHVRRGILSPLCIPIPPEWPIHYVMCYTCSVKSYNLGDIIMHSTTDISGMVKQANIVGRLARGAGGAIRSIPKGAIAGGLVGGAFALPTAGLAAGLGVGGAGMYSGAMLGSSIAAGIGGLRGFLKRPTNQRIVTKVPSVLKPTTEAMALDTGRMLPAIGIGGAVGYMASGDDSKLMGTTVGLIGGIAARPLVMQALAKRAGRV
jgi:hypothetical protein